MASIDKATMFPCDPYQNVDWRKIDGLDSCLEQATFADEPILKSKPEALERWLKRHFMIFHISCDRTPRTVGKDS